MVVLLNCLLLRSKTFDEIFVVGVGDSFKDDNNVKININDFTIDHLKVLIKCKKKVLKNYEFINLWKVELDDESKLKDVYTEEDIKNKLDGRKMRPMTKFRAEENFPLSYQPKNDNVHIIVFCGKCLLMLPLE